MATQGQQAVETILKLTVDYDKGIKAVGSYLAEIKVHLRSSACLHSVPTSILSPFLWEKRSFATCSEFC